VGGGELPVKSWALWEKGRSLKGGESRPKELPVTDGNADCALLGKTLVPPNQSRGDGEEKAGEKKRTTKNQRRTQDSEKTRGETCGVFRSKLFFGKSNLAEKTGRGR